MVDKRGVDISKFLRAGNRKSQKPPGADDGSRIGGREILLPDMQSVGVAGEANVGMVVDDERHSERREYFLERTAAFDEGALFPVRCTQLHDGGAVLRRGKRRQHHAAGTPAHVGIKNQINGKISRAHQ